jgi:hypothetical protein
MEHNPAGGHLCREPFLQETLRCHVPHSAAVSKPTNRKSGGAAEQAVRRRSRPWLTYGPRIRFENVHDATATV